MAQSTVSQAAKETGDDYTAAEHNEVVTVINSNSNDAQERLVALETDSVSSDGTTGGAASAGAGNQYVELVIDGTTYKLLHDGTV